jgi:hypothetical protein
LGKPIGAREEDFFSIINERWPEGPVVTLYVPGLSTRGVGVCLEENTFQLRLTTLAGPHDWKLAVSMATVFADLGKATIKAEGVHSEFVGVVYRILI